MRDPARFSPVFVLAPARSCSSLVVAMLGQHPALYGFPELRLFRAASIGDLLAEPTEGMPARDRAIGLLRAIAQLHDGTQSANALDRAWQWLRQRADRSVEEVFDDLLHRIAPQQGVEKSPETTLTDGALRRVQAAYPKARYVHLVRHPWATVASMVAAWSPLDYWRVPDPPEFCARFWLAQHRRIAELGAVRVRAEDVANRPETVLPKLCATLGVDARAEAVAAMTAPEHSPYASPGGGLDPGFLSRPSRRAVRLPPTLEPPPGWRIDPNTAAAVQELACGFGYQDGERYRPLHPTGRLRAVARLRNPGGSHA